MLYGNFNPRRRNHRRDEVTGFRPLDWHGAHLLAVVIGILMLCVSDAFLTLMLLGRGAREANPVMASVVYGDVTWFTMVKMTMTGMSVAVMVLLAGYRFMKMFRVEALLYIVLAGYLVLVGYELWMLGEWKGLPLLFEAV